MKKYNLLFILVTSIFIFSCNDDFEDHDLFNQKDQTIDYEILNKVKIEDGMLSFEKIEDFLLFYNELDNNNLKLLSEMKILDYESMNHKIEDFDALSEFKFKEFYSQSITMLFNKNNQIKIANEVLTLDDNNLINENGDFVGYIGVESNNLNIITKTDISDIENMQQNFISNPFSTGQVNRRVYVWIRNETIKYNNTYQSSKIKMAIALQHNSRSFWRPKWNNSPDDFGIVFQYYSHFNTYYWYGGDYPAIMSSMGNPGTSDYRLVNNIPDYILATANLDNYQEKDYEFTFNNRLFFRKINDNLYPIQYPQCESCYIYGEIPININWRN